MNQAPYTRRVKTLKTDGAYFGNYLNMARHNAYLILNDFSDVFEELKIEEINEEDLHNTGLLPRLRRSKKLDLKLKAFQKLKHHFPFLQCIDDPEKALGVLRQLLENLNRQRNCYTHGQHDEKGLFVDGNSLEGFFKAAVKKVPVRFRSIIGEADIRHMVTYEADDVRKEKGQLTSFYALVDPRQALTEKGLAFFTCLFLERRYAFRFLSRLNGFKNTTNPAFRATLEAFAMFCCRLPRPRLESGELMLDLLGELSRCPKEIYQVLGEADRQRLVASADEPEIVLDADDDPELPETIMRRYGDRFPYFALRFMDEEEYFENLRFHLKLCRVVKKEYLKETGGEVRERKLVTDVNAFGRLKDFNEQTLPPYWKGKKDIEQWSPHYRIMGNRIALKLITDAEKNRESVWPALNKEKYKTMPDAILSTYELQNLLVCQYLYKKNPENRNAEQIIQQYIENFRRFINDTREGKVKPLDGKPFFKRQDPYYHRVLNQLSDCSGQLQVVLDGYGLKVKDLPDVMREYLLGYVPASYCSEAQRKIKAVLGEVRQRIKAIEKGRAPRVGDMAQFLARDVIFLKPLNDEGRGKPNNLQYDLLQGMYAFFGKEKYSIRKLHNELALVGKQHRYTHPFLYRIRLDECNGILDFYQRYLEQKERWLTAGERLLKRNDLEVFRERYDYSLSIKERSGFPVDYKPENQPVYLPRGLFNEAVLEGLRREGVALKAGDNLVYAMGQWLMGDSQPYYLMNRYYFREGEYQERHDYQVCLAAMDEELVHLMKKREPRNKKEKQQLQYAIQDVKKVKKCVLHHEGAIRYVQSNDRVMWLMVQVLAQKEHNAAYDMQRFSLRHLFFTNEEAQMSNNLLKKEIPMKINIEDKLISDTLPLRRYGEFRAAMKDRRLKNLLSYYPQKEIAHEVIKEELACYDLRREAVFETIYSFEQVALQSSMGEVLQAKINSHGYVNHTILLGVLFEQGISLSGGWTKEEVIIMRNKINHNEIPLAESLKERVRVGGGELIIAQLFDIVVGVYNELTEKTKSLSIWKVQV
ncbi:hypothetical protein DMA11_11925 [Marinilabiliaceae bacterium JC017]|nr:hypothetical protein DMA11_11925 [Marinilabiliaceae bacterium JC017]